MKKYYRVEIVYTASLGMVSSNTYTHWAESKPESTTEHEPFKDVHKAYFENPVEADTYRQKVVKEIAAHYLR